MSMIDVGMQLVGFCIQTIPFAILVLLPYHQESEQSRLIFLRVLLVLFMASIGFSLLMELAVVKTLSVAETRCYANIYFTTTILCMGIWHIRYTKTMFIRKLLVIVIVIHYGAFIFMLSAALNAIFTFLPDSSLVIYNIRNNVINLLLLGLTYPFIFLFMKQTIRHTLYAMGQKTMKRGCLYMVLALLLYCGSVYAVTYQTEGYIINLYQGISIATIAFTDIIVYYMFFMEADMSKENYHLQQQMSIHHSMYHKITNDIEETKRIRHDVHHHLNVIATLYSQGKHKELTTYLRQYAELLHQSDELIITGQPLLDSILRYYKIRAKYFNIEVHFHVDNLTNLAMTQSTEMTVLFSNALERAIETCRTHQLSTMEVHLYLQNETLLFLISHEVIDSEKNISRPNDADDLQYLCECSGGSASFYQKNQKQISEYVLNLKHRKS